MFKLTFYLFAYWHDPRWEGFVGATVKVWDLAQNLSYLGHNVIVFLPKYNFPTVNKSFKIIEIPFINFPILRLLSFNLMLMFSLIFNYLKERPNVVYVRRMISIVPLIYAKITNAILIYEINDDPYISYQNEGLQISNFIRSFISLKIDEIYLKVCAKAYVITHEIRKKIIKRVPKIKSEKISLMPSGANTQLFRTLDKKSCRKSLRIDSSAKVVGFVGTLLSYQGIDILIDAAHDILKKEPNAIFLIIGEGPMKTKWEERVNKIGLRQEFQFTGQVDYEKVPFWINATDICIAPFLYSAGFRSPVKIFDYMACGKAVVASRISGTTDIFDSTGAIKLIEPENAKLLANTIVNLLRNDKKIREIGTKARSLVTSKFDRLSITKEIIDEAEVLVSNR